MDSDDRDPIEKGWQEFPKRGTPAVQPVRWTTTTRVGIGLMLVAAAFAFAKYLLELREAIPFPGTGTVIWIGQPAGPLTGRLRITAPANAGTRNAGLHYVVRMDDWTTRAPLAMIAVRSGETASASIPAGRYRVTIAQGKVWLGPERLFGIGGELREGVHPLEFSGAEANPEGTHIGLDDPSRGGLETRPAPAF